jgi:hypothetical protein
MASPLSVLDQQHREVSALFEQVRSPDTDHRTALAELIRRLAAHLSVERSVVLPTVKRRRLLGPDLSRELKRDHSQMGRLLVRIERRKVDSPDLVDLLTQLEDRFEQHLRRCRRLTGLGAAMDRDALDDMSTRMERAEGVILSHPHPHLLSLGPVSRAATKVASHFDTARDRTVSNQP